MSKPREYWWSYAKGMIKHYPENKRAYEELHRQNITADLSGMPSGGGGGSRTTENIALKQLPQNKQKELEAVEKAIKITSRMKNGKERMGVVDLVLWKKSHTVEGAAMKLHICKSQALSFHADFVWLVAEKYGLTK